jgi:hypothetical protein
MHEYDKSGKWLIQHFADSILRLAGVRGIISWRSLQADFVQPRRIPDGFVEVQRRGQAKPDLHTLEIATYPEARVAHQALADATMVYLDRQVLPEVVVLFLYPKRKAKALDAFNLSSPQGLTSLMFSWGGKEEGGKEGHRSLRCGPQVFFNSEVTMPNLTPRRCSCCQ